MKPTPGRIVLLQDETALLQWSEVSGCMNGQALLDGTDSLWLMSRERDDSKRPHSWHWPEREQTAN